MSMIALKTERLLGQRIKCFDNHETKYQTADRYTVVYLDRKIGGTTMPVFDCLGMSSHPFHPKGIGKHSEATLGRHLGKQISFMELPADCQRCVLKDLQEEKE